MLIFCSGIPVFAVITKIDKCEMSMAMVKDKICSTLCISSYHILSCTNYQYNHIPDIQEDIVILEFLNKVNHLRVTFTMEYAW